MPQNIDKKSILVMAVVAAAVCFAMNKFVFSKETKATA
jgi:hypothetical protein